MALLGPGLARADEAADHYNLAVQYKREGKMTEAMAECLKAIPLRSNYAAAHMHAGQPLPRAEQLPEGGRRVREGVKLEPKDAQAH